MLINLSARNFGEIDMSHKKIRILFLCTGNSCRSQMVEGWVRHLHPDTIEASSAGIEKHGMDPLAIQAMSEADADIGLQRSKLLDDLESMDFDYVITLCDHARESCPLFPGNAKMIHHGFDDPRSMTDVEEPDYLRIEPYRRVRDEIKSFVERLPDIIADN